MKYVFLISLMVLYSGLFAQTRFLIQDTKPVECESREECEAYKLELKNAKAVKVFQVLFPAQTGILQGEVLTALQYIREHSIQRWCARPEIL
jgi:hypothetical protein